jgi:CRISPR system Cascade subunit CasC
MLVELHILQNFAPSNLNRDDTGAPKDCEFGGYRRARISSQCLKRAIRTAFRAHALVPEEHLGARTKRVLDELTARLEAQGKPAAEARTVVQAALSGVGLTVKDDGKTQYLLFLGPTELDRIASVCAAHWDSLAPNVVATEPAEVAAGRGRGARDAKRAGRDAVPPEVRRALWDGLDGGRASDLALFGRMLADLPDRNIDAASQVAHALSTNRVSVEFDFYTAVDDLKPDDTAGADMLGTVEFNSACFYRYANVDVDQLTRNLDGDVGLARQTVEAFLRASIAAVPTGKQNSMAAQNPPSLVFAVVRRAGLWSLANAFVQPVRPDANGDLVQNSTRALDQYWGQLTTMYGDEELVGQYVATLDGDGLTHLGAARVGGVRELVERVGGVLGGAIEEAGRR